MNLTIVNRSRSEVSKLFVKSWVQKLAKYVPELKHYSELTLVFVSSAEMRSMNKKFRGKDYATDVLSFEPLNLERLMTPKPKKSRSSKVSARPKSPAGDNLGELVFCLSVIKRQAKSHELTFEEELGYMIIHGILHLLGYEHENNERDAATMFKLQDQTFARLLKS